MPRRYLNTAAHDTRGVIVTRFAAFLLSLALCLTVGCRKKTETAGASAGQVERPAVRPDESAAAPSRQSGAGALDKGDLKLSYQTRRGFRGGDATHRAGGDPQALQKIVADLNDRIALPYDIGVSYEDCEEPGAFYDEEKHQVTLCYQLIDEYYELFSRKVKDRAELDEVVRGAAVSTFFHEFGHALVDAWQLPITGREEDAVDQFSTLVLINETEDGERMALHGALAFERYADLGKGREKILWDEHSLDEQRFYDTICLIYGHDPEKYTYLVADRTLPVERAELCREDYPRAASSWHQLLSPYLKQPPSDAELGAR
ncbi:MAG TPA: DUF4344 domain-containing metallopeptidase [Pyrinomonadaceae bacterium]|jgi:hypothetical protein|nr:DUF4344 domain-containing metallopeptidase [Pyrinomonadaceae bacterium]